MFKMFKHIKLSQTAKYYRSWWMLTDDGSLRPWLWLQSACVNCRNMQKLTMTVASNKVGASTADFESMADPSAFLDTCPCSESYAAVRLGQFNNAYYCFHNSSMMRNENELLQYNQGTEMNRNDMNRPNQHLPAYPHCFSLASGSQDCYHYDQKPLEWIEITVSI